MLNVCLSPCGLKNHFAGSLTKGSHQTRREGRHVILPELFVFLRPATSGKRPVSVPPVLLGLML